MRGLDYDNDNDSKHITWRPHPGQLREAGAAIADWLARERRLALNPRYGTVEPCRQPAVFLGWRIAPAGLSPSRRLRRRLKDRIAAAARRGPRALARTLSAYRGLCGF